MLKQSVNQAGFSDVWVNLGLATQDGYDVDIKMWFVEQPG